jgi:hypothetical protein
MPQKRLSRFSFSRNSLDITNDEFTRLLSDGNPQIEPIPVYQIFPLSRTTHDYEDTCISASGLFLALVHRKAFQIFKAIFDTDIWRLTPHSPNTPFGLSAPSPDSTCRILAAMSDKALFIALPANLIEVYKITGDLVRRIELRDQCRIIVVSYCCRFVAVSTTLGVYLYNAGTSGNFDDGMASDNQPEITPIMVMEMHNSWGRGMANCMTFSPSSSFFSMCTCENVIYTYTLDGETGRPTLLYRFDRRFDHTNIPEPYYGVTGLALYLQLCFKLTKVRPTLTIC